MSVNFLLGMNAKLYYDSATGTASVELSVMTEVTNVKDVTVNMDAADADITTRGNSGWRAKAATLRENTVEFEMQWKPGDAAFTAIRDAFLANGELHFAILDQVYTTSGAQGPKGDYTISSFNRNEPLEDSITVSVTLNLSLYNEWFEAP